ncbi:putative isomerase YbhE [Thozetella sp. PMI_491]|nr:putative isomerase YbhE [Thozetella sp. PMI_491]
MGIRSLATWLLPGATSTTLLYVASYAGTLTTLGLTASSRGDVPSMLERVSVSDGCAGNSTWLTLDKLNGILYCLEEGLDRPNGTLSSFKTSGDGILIQLGRTPTIGGPVSSVIYGQDGSGLAVSEYGGSGFQTYSIADASNLIEMQRDVFKLDQPGSNPERQEAPHPHQVVLDPTGNFFLVPDLGADLVRIFSIDQKGLQYTPSGTLSVPAGSGPRHVSWLVTGTKTFLFLISELANSITTFEVSYDNSSLGFRQTYVSSTYGLNKTAPAGAAAAEVVVSPDQRFLILSSRMENSIQIPNWDSNNSTQIPSDPIITFSINAETGALAWLQTFPAGGRVPRQFSVNKAGTLLAVGLQEDGRVAVINREPVSGLLKDFAATIPVGGGITSVIFDE